MKTCNDEVDFDGKCLRLGDSKTGESVQPASAPALTLLRARKAVAKSNYVFGRLGKPYRGLPKAWGRIVTGASLDDLTPHGLRHGFASMANAEGMTLPTIRALLGHSSRLVTEDYTHELDGALLAAADRVSRRIYREMTARAGRSSDFQRGKHKSPREFAPSHCPVGVVMEAPFTLSKKLLDELDIPKAARQDFAAEISTGGRSREYRVAPVFKAKKQKGQAQRRLQWRPGRTRVGVEAGQRR